ncbi:CC0125/CC1285 family lipoprotein [Alteromonas lipolytica]|uniref:Lipoprotein n=1 Tax=Alteromonas lipolytica TaxID=1856405 RepID=A0A1E8FG16_9ALTE|nr:hypothetical protein [Alteromonas lipolytica]OFI34864.1 hypothetical protein BFC17_14920 [Alteromonas lipolytica]GGF54600.1 hypothetical protein GCM10011338_03520 [Alteromonas lipolytica]
MDIQLLARLFSNTALIKAMMFAVVTTCMLTGCAGSGLSATPYQPAGQAGTEGYSSHQLTDGKYKIMYKANSATSEELLLKYSQRRAEEIAAAEHYTWYRIVSSDAVSLSALDNQQIITAAPEEPRVNGIITGDIDEAKLPGNQQCTASGCESVNSVTIPDTDSVTDENHYYTMTVQMGRYEPRPSDAILLK